jgi:Icc-related predicted phosphoesterase
MKILFISDVYSWEKSFEVLENESPDYVLLGGDLISDGATEFKSLLPFNYQEYRVKIAAYLRKHQDEIEKTKWGLRLNNIITKIQKGELFDKDGYYHFEDGATNSLRNLLNRIFNDLDNRDQDLTNTSESREWRNQLREFLDGLVQSFRNSEHFQKGAQNHIDLFYKFLENAGKVTDGVYAVKGNHDKYYEKDYDDLRINNIAGCQEISGKLVNLDNYKLLGLGYDETHYLRKLRPLLHEYKGIPEIILTHAEDKRLSLISDFKPKIVFRGHWGSGRYTVNNTEFVTPSVFPRYLTVEMKNHEIKSIYHYRFKSNQGFIQDKLHD